VRARRRRAGSSRWTSSGAYTVAGMCAVNFLGGLHAIHPVLKHNNNYFSYADTIMPGFLFACGFSYGSRRSSASVGSARARPTVGSSCAAWDWCSSP